MSLKRRDGRAREETRKFRISYDGLDRADGSARFQFGETTVQASVSGPTEVRLASEQASKATFEVLVRPLCGVPGTESKSMAATLRTLLVPSLILTTNPRTLIQLVIQSYTPPYSPFAPPSKRPVAPTFTAAQKAAFINASTLALMDASSFPMRALVCAAAVGRLRTSASKSSMLIVDPSEDESDSGDLDGEGCFAFMFAFASEEGKIDSKPVWTSWAASGSGGAHGFDEGELEEAIVLARGAAVKVWKAMRASVEVKYGVRSGKADISMDSDLSSDSEDSEEEVDDDKMEI